MKHPSQETLALQAGGDLGWWEQWKTARHLSGCDVCRDDVAAFSEVREVLPELNALPEFGQPWHRLAAEMRANIRLGLVAGECVRVSDTPPRESPLFNGARALVAFASVCAMLLAAVVLERPAPVHASEPMVQATYKGIQRRSGDRAFGLMHPGAQEQDVTYTVGAQGTMGARYVDPETGVMTMTKVYVE